jgi:hypothetical protein
MIHLSQKGADMPSGTGDNGGCLFAVFNVLFGKRKAEEALPYRVRDDFLSASENSFYRVLLIVCGEQCRVFPKVNLADILFVKKGSDNPQGFRNRINTRHVDYLLCNPQTLRPILAVELDDASHMRSDRRERDEFVDRAFQAAGLPILHVPAKNTYDVQELRVQIAGCLAQSPRRALENTGPNQGDSEKPACPKCGTPMVIRKSGKTDQAFYGCANYPKCRETRPL